MSDTQSNFTDRYSRRTLDALHAFSLVFCNNKCVLQCDWQERQQVLMEPLLISARVMGFTGDSRDGARTAAGLPEASQRHGCH